MTTKPIAPRKLIAQAVKIIERERRVVVDSCTNHEGTVTDYPARRWIREYDRFLKPARVYLGRAKR